MLIKTGYPNLLHGYDFLCLNLMNYYAFEKRSSFNVVSCCPEFEVTHCELSRSLCTMIRPCSPLMNSYAAPGIVVPCLTAAS